VVFCLLLAVLRLALLLLVVAEMLLLLLEAFTQDLMQMAAVEVRLW
jgi:hypothetical protein